MEDILMDRDNVEIITAFAKSSKTYESLTDDVCSENSEVFRNDMRFTNKEKDAPLSGTQRYLVVGYTLRYWKTDLLMVPQSKAKQTHLGMTRPEDDEIYRWEEYQPPVYVVTEILPEKPHNVTYFALVMPMNGLCYAFVVPQEMVFFRHEFRVKEASLIHKDAESRISAWNDKVLSYAVRPSLQAAPLTQSQERSQRAENSASLAVTPDIRWAKEVTNLVSNYALSPNELFFEEILKVLEEASPDLKHRPSNLALRVFVEQRKYLTQDQATEVVESINHNWPEIYWVSEEYIMELKGSLIRNKTLLEYRLLKPFLSEACWRLNRNDKEDQMSTDNRMIDKKRQAYVDGVVDRVIRAATRMLGPAESPPPTPTAQQIIIISRVIGKLEDIVAADAGVDEELEESCGDSAFDSSVSDIWAKYPDCSDTDTARACMMEMARLVASTQRQKFKGMIQMLASFIDVLEENQPAYMTL